jgi:hypothetical protein
VVFSTFWREEKRREGKRGEEEKRRGGREKIKGVGGKN